MESGLGGFGSLGSGEGSMEEDRGKRGSEEEGKVDEEGKGRRRRMRRRMRRSGGWSDFFAWRRSSTFQDGRARMRLQQRAPGWALFRGWGGDHFPEPGGFIPTVFWQVDRLFAFGVRVFLWKHDDGTLRPVRRPGEVARVLVTSATSPGGLAVVRVQVSLCSTSHAMGLGGVGTLGSGEGARKKMRGSGGRRS